MNPHPLNKKRQLGAFYTPPELSRVLTDWAIRRAHESILEPSFGGCGFFDSSIERLRELGCESPERQLYGVDIDQHAFDILSKKFDKIVEVKKRFIKNDFIKVQPQDFSVPGFDVVIGNPPYVSMHNMTSVQRSSCEQILRASPFSASTMGRNASLWAFFLVHSLSFLNDGGRVAWVLPSSLLHSDYAKRLIEIHKGFFESIKIIKLAERFFREEGAQETSVILLAEGFSKNGVIDCSLNVKSVEDLIMLKSIISSPDSSSSSDIENYKYDIISKEALDVYKKLCTSDVSAPLGYHADIKIGMVTGANKLFIINRKTAVENSLEEHVLKPVIGKFSSLQGIFHNRSKQNKIHSSGERVLLVCPSELEMLSDSYVSKYLSQLDIESRESNRTFKKRPHWYAPGYGIDGIIPDAFLSYMIHLSPRMVINQAKVNCTNSVHKVLFRDKNCSTNFKMAISISLLSSFSQLSAELEGRAYSSGVLKIEPSSGRKIQILMNEAIINDLVLSKGKIDKLLIEGDQSRATDIVDKVLVEHAICTAEEISELRKAARQLRNERYKGVKKLND
jgi:adenine-specific DNA methylase|tara:strand:+ start:1767 stop:3455 length:1689 start_codon:yes stop_codon:yes gene_type:complete